MITPWQKPHEVLVRFAPTETYDSVEFAAAAGQFLDEAELRVLKKLHLPAMRRDYMAAHALARLTLAEFVGCEPRQFHFGHSATGRPELVSPPDGAERLSFSISRTSGLVLCAVALDGTVGADVEGLDQVGTDVLNMAEIVCSETELKGLRAMPGTARAEHFLELWTLKEAIAKAMGLGLHLVFNGITIQFRKGSAPAVKFAPETAGGSSTWRLELRRPTARHAIAIAVCDPPGPEVTFRVEEKVLFQGGECLV